MFLTTYEAAEKSGLSIRYIRKLLADGVLKGRQAKINASKSIWLVEEKPLLKYLKTPRKLGRPKK